MGPRSFAAKHIGRWTRKALRASGRDGSSLPGKLAMRMDPEILRELGRNYRIVIVTGTNGKTQTTGLITAILRKKYRHVLTNPSGANMVQGVVSSFLTTPKTRGPKIAVLEVDEASLRHVTRYLSAEVIVFTNIFRDQMDRYGEIYTTWSYMLEGAKNAPGATLIVNGDCPIFHDIPLQNTVRTFGFDHEADGDMAAHFNTDGVLCPHCQKILRYYFITYSNLGKYYCPHCGVARRRLTHRVNAVRELTMQASDFEIDGTRIRLPIAGLYNVYNALAAFAVAFYFDMAPALIAQAMSEAKSIFGRQESIEVDGHDVTLNLIKNPVGFNQIVELLRLEPEPFDLMVLLNDRPADGTDVSWIWDGQFEELVALTAGRPVMLSGLRTAELSTRFEVAGVPRDEQTIETDIDKLAGLIAQAPHRKVHILATYTALLDLRAKFREQGFVEGGMEA